MFIDRDLVTSEAYLSLKTTACYIVYGIFLTKRQLENQGDRYNPCWVITNNSKITFTYREALEKYGISAYKFEKAIANLVEVGLLDVAKPGKYKQPTLYALSDRWKLYGEEAFVQKEVTKRITQSGFQKGNKYGRNCSPEERARYRKELKEKKAEKLLAQIDQLKRDKLSALLEDKGGRQRSRIPAIIDEEIEGYADRLRRLQGT
jgi:hypothetical protein